MCGTSMTKSIEGKASGKTPPMVNYYLPERFNLRTQKKPIPLTVTKYGLANPSTDSLIPLINPKYNIKIEAHIFSKKGSEKKIGMAYLSLDTTKIALSSDGKSGTISCTFEENHDLVKGGDSYKLYYKGSATLILSAVAVDLNEVLQDDATIDIENIGQHLKSLKVNSKSLVVGFKNNIDLRGINPFNPRVEVIAGKHSVYPASTYRRFPYFPIILKPYFI